MKTFKPTSIKYWFLALSASLLSPLLAVGETSPLKPKEEKSDLQIVKNLSLAWVKSNLLQQKPDNQPQTEENTEAHVRIHKALESGINIGTVSISTLPFLMNYFPSMAPKGLFDIYTKFFVMGVAGGLVGGGLSYYNSLSSYPQGTNLEEQSKENNLNEKSHIDKTTSFKQNYKTIIHDFSQCNLNSGHKSLKNNIEKLKKITNQFFS